MHTRTHTRLMHTQQDSKYKKREAFADLAKAF